MTGTGKKEVLVVPNRQVSDEDKDSARAVSVRHFLWSVVEAYKKRTDPATWAVRGGPDVEEFLECLETGRPHPLLEDWQVHKSEAANRPAPSSRETSARRLAVLACVALERMGVRKKDARRLVAEQLVDANVFATAPSAGALRNWERRQISLTPQDETVIANARAEAGTDHNQLVAYFVGLMHATHTPAPFLEAFGF
jgi:hypothetical protein